MAHEIYFNLDQMVSLKNIVPDDDGEGNFSTVDLPEEMSGQAIYLIVNANTNNRYIGSTSNMAVRFRNRFATVNELGYTPEHLKHIFVYWGTVTYTPHGGPQKEIKKYGHNGSKIKFPTDQILDPEHILIRFITTMSGFGGTVTNNKKREEYKNNTSKPIEIKLTWQKNDKIFENDDGKKTGTLNVNQTI